MNLILEKDRDKQDKDKRLTKRAKKNSTHSQHPSQATSKHHISSTKAYQVNSEII